MTTLLERITEAPPATFEAWVQSMPPEKTYEYTDTCGCAFAQFLIHEGIRFDAVGISYWRDARGKHDIPEDVKWALYEEPYSFGALAERLEKTA